MARTALVPTTTPKRPTVSPVANAADFAMVAGDVANGNSVPYTGKEVLIANNTDVGAQTITIDAAPDAYGRDGTITAYSIGASEYAAFDLSDKIFQQSDGNIHINAAHAGVLVGVVRVSSI